MFDTSRCTTIDKDVLTRLIAAARITDTVAWVEAETEAEHEVATLWGGRGRAEQMLPVEVSTEVVVQLAAAAQTAVDSRQASGSSWCVQITHDLAEIRKTIRAAGI